MDKEKALKELEYFEHLKNVMGKTEKADAVKLIRMRFSDCVMISMIALFFSMLPLIPVSSFFENELLFYLSAIFSIFILTFFISFIMMHFTNKTKSFQELVLLNELQSVFEIEGICSFFEYKNKCSKIFSEKQKELSKNEEFVNTILTAMKEEDKRFEKHCKDIIKLSQPITSERIRRKEEMDKINEMHSAINQKMPSKPMSILEFD